MVPEAGDRDEPIDILLVEPNPGDTRLFTEQFREAKIGNTIHTVTDGESALAFVSQEGAYEDTPHPDIILLDLKLPGTSGIDVLDELSTDPELAEIPVVVLTSSELGKDIVSSHDLEADAYFRKPVEPEEFVEFVQSVEEFWLTIVTKTQA